jgi:hypothetical protein
LVFVSTQLPEHDVSAPQVVPHWPPEHVSPVAHTPPHSPQFAESVAVSTHAPPHFARPGSHTKSQALALQVAEPNAGALHAVVQFPQCRGSDEVSMQAPPHAVRPVSQAIEQALAEQTALPFAGVGQALPQSPQLSAFCVTSTHEPEQALNPPGQTFVQPVGGGAHTSLTPHVTVQVPQCFGSFIKFTQAPLQFV